MQQEPKKHVSHAIAWSLIALLAGTLAFGIWTYFSQISDIYDNSVTISFSHKKTATAKPTTATTGSTTTDTTADWKIYTNDTYGFSFKYPAVDIANGDKSDSDSNVYIRSSDKYWLYAVTVAPNTANQTLDQVAKQNFDKLSTSITSYMTSEAGTTPTFARSDLSIGGTPAKKMVTTNKTGYSPSAEVVLIKNSNIITISPRAESDEFDTILSTFTFTK